MKIVVEYWKFSMLLLYILGADWPIFMISISIEQLHQELEYTLLTPGCYSWWISKMQSDSLEERYVIKCNKKCHRNVCMNQASVFECHKRFNEGRDSERDDERCGRSKEVSTPELIGQRVRVTMLNFKGVQEEIPPKEASTLQIGFVEFPLGQCTRPQFHPCHRLFDQDGPQDSSTLSL